jgi:hypothetical protein
MRGEPRLAGELYACALAPSLYQGCFLPNIGDGELSSREHYKMEKFEYPELLGKDYIRVIELLPGDNCDTIICNLTSERRQDIKNTYDAISYAWGNPNNTVPIICCDRILSITASLADALRTIRSRSPKAPQRLWADAICINQQSSEEKNHQVKRMGQVYENARQVLAWLGPDEDGDALDCFNLLKECNLHLDKLFDGHKHIRDIESYDTLSLICNDPERWSKIRRLMSRSWFSRVWVVQEAGLAKECHLLWGDQSMSFAELIEFACFCDGRTSITKLMGRDDLTLGFWGIVFDCIYRTYSNASSWGCSKPLIQSLYEKRLHSPGLFLDVLQIGKSLSAADPRDHIYAFLGNPLASSNEGKLLVEPDYDKDVRELYFDIACALLKSRHESPYVLCFVQHTCADEVTGSNGPSWIPRWKKSETGPMPFFSIGNIGLSHMTGGSADMLQYRVHRGFGDERLLSLQGFIFDHLTWTSELLKTENFALNPGRWDDQLRTSQKAYIEVLWKSVPLAFKQCQGPTELLEYARYHNDFSFTLVTGYDNRQSRKDHRKRFKAYLQSLRRAYNPEQCTTAASLSGKEACNASRYEVNTRNCSNRRLAVTKLGRFALVPQFAQPGDVCCMFLGMVTPFVLRSGAAQFGDKGRYYHLVGEAYVHGVMSGELVKGLNNTDIEKNEVTLI